MLAQVEVTNMKRGPGGSMSLVVGLPSNSCKPITNMVWVRAPDGFGHGDLKVKY
jgi:hypothetical protein